MFNSPIDFVKAGKLTTTIVAACFDQTGIVIAGAGADALLEAHDRFAAKQPGLAKIIKASERRLKQSLKSPAFADTDGLHTLLWAKLDYCAGHIADPENPIPDAAEIYDRMKIRLASFENRTPASMTAFEKWMRPELKILCDDTNLKHILGPAIERSKAKERKEHREELRKIKVAMEQPQAQTDKILADVAGRFDLPDAENYSRTFLLDYLHKNAKDIQPLSREAAKFEASNDHISHLHAKAIRALENYERDTAKSLLAEAQSLNAAENLRPALETNAELSRTEAEIALLENEAETAYQILSAAADSFRTIDDVSAIKKRLTFDVILYDHGVRFGGSGVELSLKMDKAALSEIDKTTHPDLYGRAKNNSGNALLRMGEAAKLAESETLLLEAEQSLRSALEHFTDATPSEKVANTKSNLGLALKLLSARSSKRSPKETLAEAIVFLEESVEALDSTKFPLEFTNASLNLASALRIFSDFQSGATQKATLSKSIEVYRKVAKITSKSTDAETWGSIKNNLGNVLLTYAAILETDQKAEITKEAIREFKFSLEHRTEIEFPIKWALTQFNLGRSHIQLAQTLPKSNQINTLSEAVSFLDAAFRVYSQDKTPVPWAWIHHNLANAKQAITSCDGCTEPQSTLQVALNHVDKALSVYDPIHMPYDHGTATTLRDDILTALAS